LSLSRSSADERGHEQYHEKNGVKFHMQSKTTKLSPASPSHSSVHSVSIAHATSGESKTLEADVVILGVGVAPLIGLVEKLDGVKSEKGGIVVNEYLEVEGLNNVYAIGEARRLVCYSLLTLRLHKGDIAAYPDKRSGELKRIEHWNVNVSSLVSIDSSNKLPVNNRSRITTDEQSPQTSLGRKRRSIKSRYFGVPVSCLFSLLFRTGNDNLDFSGRGTAVEILWKWCWIR
jgi:hypothetical protein